MPTLRTFQKHDAKCEAVYFDLIAGYSISTGGKCYCRDRLFARHRGLIDAAGVPILIFVLIWLILL